jgi:hypothetical protein
MTNVEVLFRKELLDPFSDTYEVTIRGNKVNIPHTLYRFALQEGETLLSVISPSEIEYAHFTSPQWEFILSPEHISNILSTDLLSFQVVSSLLKKEIESLKAQNQALQDQLTELNNENYELRRDDLQDFMNTSE